MCFLCIDDKVCYAMTGEDTVTFSISRHIRHTTQGHFELIFPLCAGKTLFFCMACSPYATIGCSVALTADVLIKKQLLIMLSGEAMPP